MSIGTTSSVSPVLASLNSGTAQGSPSPSNSLGQADFLKLLMAQMQHQDPMSPMSGTDFTAQLAQFSSLQGIQQLNTNISSMLLLQGLTQGANLIGKNVTYAKPASNANTQGAVSSVKVDGTGSVQLVIGGTGVALSQVRGIAA
jgi:flagellar basal-body rod modification protein FlgD